MASKAVTRPLASVSAAIGVRHATSRGFATTQQQGHQITKQLLRSEPKRCVVQIPQRALQSSFRRSYADGPVATVKTKRRARGFFRWTWRLMYLSAVGVLGYTGYSIYQGRNPADQAEPDPNKKTLVVLGEWHSYRMR